MASSHAHTVKPYRGLARSYDRLVGKAMLPTICRSFERCVRQLHLRFRCAADVGCGTGTFLRYLLRYRVPLVGVDSSPQMLEVAARRLPANRVALLHQDMRELRLPSPVDLVTCNGDTLNYLLKPRQLGHVLQRCAANLCPGGHLVGDLLVGSPSGINAPALQVGLPGHQSQWRATVDTRRRLTRVDVATPATGGGWLHEHHIQRWHSTAALDEALRYAGLRLRALWRLDGPPSATSRGWVKFAAHKT